MKFASERLRSLVFDPRRPELGNRRLVSALRAYLEHAEREEGLEFTVDDQLSTTPEPELRTFLYSVSQELLMNVRKHAQASRVKVSLAARVGRHVIRVTDNGATFDVAEALRPRSGHLGLATLSEQLEQAGGVLRTESAAGAPARRSSSRFQRRAKSPMAATYVLRRIMLKLSAIAAVAIAPWQPTCTDPGSSMLVAVALEAGCERAHLASMPPRR